LLIIKHKLKEKLERKCCFLHTPPAAKQEIAGLKAKNRWPPSWKPSAAKSKTAGRQAKKSLAANSEIAGRHKTARRQAKNLRQASLNYQPLSRKLPFAKPKPLGTKPKTAG
jgi:hypothetical protein